MLTPDVLSQPSVYWFLIGLGLALFELVLPGLIVIFFGAGAWTAAIVCLIYPVGLNAELAIFTASSLLYAAALRKRIKQLMDAPHTEEPDVLLEEYVGSTATVHDAIAPDQLGSVMFRGTLWKAQSEETIPAGKQVTICDKKNITLTVTTKKL